MMEKLFHNYDKTRSLSFRSRRIILVLAFLALFLFAICCLRALAPFLSLRNVFCHNLLTPASASINTTTVLDRLTAATAESGKRSSLRHLTTLVLVAGHAIFTGTRWDMSSLSNEQNWILEPFQKGQVRTFLRHIQRGVELAANDTSALLLFSGGQTRNNSGPRSEGMTYWTGADALNWFGYGISGSAIKNRSFAEEYARDSFENVLFSVCRFHQLTGNYPRVIKVVSFHFKKHRFDTMHRRAMRFPAHRFLFYGIDPIGTNGMRTNAIGERSQALGPFSSDPYGCNSRVLSSKRQGRNPYMRYHPYPQGCAELSGLFRHCSRKIFSGALPWDARA